MQNCSNSKELRHKSLKNLQKILKLVQELLRNLQFSQLGIGQSWRKLAEIGQKRDFRALFSEIYMKIEDLSSLEHNSTSASIAQLAARLTFFICFRPDLTRVGVGSIPP
jgi:hypothetical protein